MAFFGQHLHQPVLTVAGIHAEGRHTARVPDTAPKDRHTSWLTPAIYRTTTARKTDTRPPAKKNRYCDFQALELNRTACSFVYTVIHGLQEEGTENGSGHNQEDAGEEPACRSLGRLGIAAAELAIHLDTANQTEYGFNGINTIWWPDRNTKS